MNVSGRVACFSTLSYPSSIQNVFCAGRNYVAHAKELGNAPAKDEPFFFLKPASSLVFPPNPIRVPIGAVLSHEVELAVVLKERISRLQDERQALNSILGYCVVIDVTARNWQNDAKAKGLPWTKAKGCDTFLPCGPLVTQLDGRFDPSNVTLSLAVNGVERQHGSTSQMIHSVPQLLMHLSRFHTLHPGDMVLSGTPSGVGPLVHGDVVEIAGLGTKTKFEVRDAED